MMDKMNFDLTKNGVPFVIRFDDGYDSSNEFPKINVGEEREVVIKYRVGHEEDCKVTFNGDAYRSMEDSSAVIYGLAKLVERGAGTPTVSWKKVADKIIMIIFEYLFNSMLNILKEVNNDVPKC